MEQEATAMLNAPQLHPMVQTINPQEVTTLDTTTCNPESDLLGFTAHPSSWTPAYSRIIMMNTGDSTNEITSAFWIQILCDAYF